jgi:hypothetical protein
MPGNGAKHFDIAISQIDWRRSFDSGEPRSPLTLHLRSLTKMTKWGRTCVDNSFRKSLRDKV